MADRMKSSAGWLLEHISTQFDEAIKDSRARLEPHYEMKAQSNSSPKYIYREYWHLRIRCDRSDSALYAQVVNFIDAPHYSVELSDSQHKINAIFDPRAIKRYHAKNPGRKFPEKDTTTGAVITLRQFEIAGKPLLGPKHFHLFVMDFDYFGVCSHFGNPTEIKSVEGVVKQVKILDDLKAGVQDAVLNKTPIERALIKLGYRYEEISSVLRDAHTTLADLSVDQIEEMISARRGREASGITSSGVSDTTARPADHEGQATAPSESTSLKVTDELRGLLLKDQDRNRGKSSNQAVATKASIIASGLTSSGDGDDAKAEPAKPTPLSKLKPEDSYIFPGNFKFAAAIGVIREDEFYHEQMRLCSLPEAQYPPPPGVKFNEANFPVDAVNRIRAVVQKRAAYKEAQQAKRMQQALQQEAIKEEEDAGIPSSEPYEWPSSPEPMIKREPSLPPDSSAPEELPEAGGQLAEADSEDEVSDLEMQEPSALVSLSPKYTVTPQKRLLEVERVPSSGQSHGSSQQDSKRHKPVSIASPQSVTPCNSLEDYFMKFQQAYPRHTGDFKHFVSLLKKAAQQLATSWLADDYIIRHITDYTPYSTALICDGETPMPYKQFYRECCNLLTYRKKVVTERTFALLDPEDRVKDDVLVSENSGEIEEQSVIKPSRSPTKTNNSCTTSYEPLSHAKVLQDTDESDDKRTRPQTLTVSSTPFSTQLPSSPSPSPERNTAWWQQDSTAFKEFARGYGNLKSMKGVLGEVLPSGNNSNRIFSKPALTFDVSSWSLGS